MSFISDLLTGIRTHTAVSGVLRRLSDLDAYAPVSVVLPSPASQSQGLPAVEDFKGLRGVCELKRSDGNVEWQFFWASDWAADRGEDEYRRVRGPAAFSRSTIRSANAVKPSWWRRAWPWTLATGFLASVAAAGSNVESIKDLYSQLQHEPAVTVETTDLLRVGSRRPREVAEIVLRGDPFFRTRIEQLKMRIVPEDPLLALPHSDFTAVPNSDLSIDVSAPMPLKLPVGNLPAGRYRVELTGVAHTSWKSANLKLEKPLVLDVRKPVRLRTLLVNAYPSPVPAGGKFSDVLAEFALDFGRVDQTVAAVRVVINGNWVEWSMQFQPTKATLSKESDNSASAPKSIIFSFQQLPMTSFTSDTFRIAAKSSIPMTETEWLAVLNTSIAEITNVE